MQVKTLSLLSAAFVMAGCAAVPADAATATRSATTIPVTLAATVARPTQSATVTSSTATPQLTATPRLTSQFTQLTQGACCVQPAFSPDGSMVIYLDRPAPNAPAGIWGVPVNAPLSDPQRITEKLGPFSRDMTLVADLIRGQTVIERLSDGQRWTINNGGRQVSFSPDGRLIAWAVQQEAGGFDVRRSEIWLAKVDGTQRRQVATRFGGGLIAWLPDSQRVLLGGKVNRNDALSTLSMLSLADGATDDILQYERMRSPLLSPDGRWLAFLVAQARDASQNGVFLLDLEAAEAQPKRLDFFGAYRWRDDNRLLLAPVQVGAPSNELWQVDAGTLEMTQLIAASAESPFKIGNGDWDVSPDGARLVYLNARDRNLWLAQLP